LRAHGFAFSGVAFCSLPFFIEGCDDCIIPRFVYVLASVFCLTRRLDVSLFWLLHYVCVRRDAACLHGSLHVFSDLSSRGGNGIYV
jgi:hypothetical protein